MGKVVAGANLLDRIKRLERTVAEQFKKIGLSSARIDSGGLTLTNDAFFRLVDDLGVEIVYFGPDSLGRQIIRIRREGGGDVMWTGFTSGGTQFWRLTDRFNRELFSDDTITGGMARPYLPVQMFPKFSMAASSVYAYLNLPAASVAAETTLWEGRIGLVSHPYFTLAGIWGQASGSNSTIYRVRITGTQVATFTVGAALENNTKGPYSMSAYLGLPEVQVTVTAEATGTGNVACQLYNFTQRQTP